MDGPYFGQETGRDDGGQPYMRARTVDQRGQAPVITVCFNGEDPGRPARAGEYILETDELRFFPDWPDIGHGALWVGSSGYVGYRQTTFQPISIQRNSSGTLAHSNRRV
jgi:hypothetical protein